MKCSRCGSENVQVQYNQSLKTQHQGCLYWLLIGWWLNPLLWIFATLPMLLIAIFIPKRQKMKSTKMFVCNSCGHSWRA